jgi:uncharacterized membrane protein YjjB (DUF3815 family)
MIFPPVETTLQLKPAKTFRGYVLQSHTKQVKYVYSAAALGMTVAGVVSTYCGYNLFLPILTGTWVLSMVATMSGPRITMKHMILVLNGIVVSYMPCNNIRWTTNG